jgi:hypothetical protein
MRMATGSSARRCRYRCVAGENDQRHLHVQRSICDGPEWAAVQYMRSADRAMDCATQVHLRGSQQLADGMSVTKLTLPKCISSSPIKL